jgi:hypothetical protein
MMELGLVITITIISVFAMVTVKGYGIQEESVFIEDVEEDNGKPEGTGYMFDDFDKAINIPFEKEKDAEPKKDNESSQLEQEKYRRALERNMTKLKSEMESSNNSSDSSSFSSSSKQNTITYNSTNIRSKSKGIISKVRNNISFEDKISLLMIVKSLSLSELNDIKNAILNGTTNAESIKLWTMLRNKLPNDEYKKLENIIVKYE